MSEIKARAGVELSEKAEYCNLPLVYSCSGCSSAAQLANSLAIRLDRERLAEMSCIAGVGGGVRSLVKTAQSGRKIMVMDGCSLHCTKLCLDRYGIPINVHVDLSMAGVKKRFHQGATPKEEQHVWSNVVLPEIARLS
jgi:uncharacterized metal-binding protein